MKYGQPLGSGSDVANFVHEVFNHPIAAARLQGVCRRPMLPHGVGERTQWIVLPFGLRQQAGNVTRQHVAAAALREMRIAGGIHQDIAFVPAMSVCWPFNTTHTLP